jgi:hypothetical protein
MTRGAYFYSLPGGHVAVLHHSSGDKHTYLFQVRASESLGGGLADSTSIYCLRRH